MVLRAAVAIAGPVRHVPASPSHQRGLVASIYYVVSALTISLPEQVTCNSSRDTERAVVKEDKS